MTEWSFRVDKVHVQNKPYKPGEVPREGVVNISKEKEEIEEYRRVSAEEHALQNDQTYPALAPLHSSWFNMQTINDIEKRAFKNQIKTPEEEKRYKTTRNKIFKMFQDAPNRYLSITQCRKSVPEDISSIIGIHGFLEHWGLINYKIGAKRDVASMMEKICQKDLYSVEKGSADKEDLAAETGREAHRAPHPREHIAVVGESPAPLPNIELSVQKEPRNTLCDLSKNFSLQSNGPKIKHIPTEVECTECSRQMNGLGGEDKIYFSDTDRIILCKRCFDDGRYPPTFSYANFHLLESGVIRQIWTVEEEMLLVEGIEMYKDDWKAVSAYVKTKTVEQCVLHFLKMGIQDPLLEMKGLAYGENSVPFNYSLNPIMTTVSFLASVVHPGVASAAAKAAMKEIQRLSEEQPNEKEKLPWINDRLNEIAAVALSSCIPRANEQKVLEESKKERLLELLVESEMKRIEEKVAEFTELTKTLKKEKEDLEKMRETYKKAHLETRREISDTVAQVKKICNETGRNFEEVFFKR